MSLLYDFIKELLLNYGFYPKLAMYGGGFGDFLNSGHFLADHILYCQVNPGKDSWKSSKTYQRNLGQCALSLTGFFM